MAVSNKHDRVIPLFHTLSNRPSPIQTLTVGPGISPGPAKTARGLKERILITADWDFHPTPKELWYLINIIE